MEKQRELQDQLEDLTSRELKLEQRIDKLEHHIQTTRVITRITNLERFLELVIVISIGIVIFKLFL